MKNKMIKWYQVKVDMVEVSAGLGFQMAYQDHHDACYLSPNVRIASDKAAMIRSRALAQAYANACAPIFVKRGQTVNLQVVPVECPDSKYTAPVLEKIQEHSDIIQARLDQNVMAANKRPKL